MYDEVIKKILELIDDKAIIGKVYPKFSGKGYKPYELDARNFQQINKLNSSKRIAFVDGGNAEIIGASNFSLNLIRFCYIVYQDNKKIAFKKFENLAFVQTINKNNEMHYQTSFFKTKGSIEFDEISFDSFDRTLMLGTNRAEIGSVANAIRRFAELKLAESISNEKKADIIVLDGNLQATLTNEDMYLNQLYETCSKNNVILTALSKTTSLFTDDGDLLSVVLDNISGYPSWLYCPIAEIKNINHKAEMIFVKLHEKSKHVFRFEIFSEQKEKAEEAVNILASNCIDPIFIGYPYGSVEADKTARVSNQEKNALKTMLLIKLRNKNIDKYLSSVNAHEILDGISF